MPAKLRLDRRRQVTRLQRKGRRCEFRHHPVLREEARSPLRRPNPDPSRVPWQPWRNPRPLEPDNDLLRVVLVLDQDMAGTHLFDRFDLRHLLIIELLDGGIAGRSRRFPEQELLHQHALLHIGHAALEILGLVDFLRLGLLGHDLHLDQEIRA